VLTKRRRRPGGGTGAAAGGVLGGADGHDAVSPGGGSLEGPVQSNEPNPHMANKSLTFVTWFQRNQGVCSYIQIVDSVGRSWRAD
jgi:hypothetical protein